MNAEKHKPGGIISALIAGSLFVFLLLPPYAHTASEAEQLIVFVQPDASEVEKAFRERRLPEIRKLAEAMGVSVHVIDARKGSPAEVGITPLIVYQNHRGRSIYQGRTTTPQRIRNFIRTSRFVPQGKEPNRREDISIRQEGRARVWAPLKVAGITGTPPANYNKEAFVAEALQNIAKGFEKFQLKKVVKLDRAARGFYMDFNPWLSRDGTLYLSLVLFSQFDCKAPVFKKKIVGPWQDYQSIFRQAATMMEDSVARITGDPDSGDSFDPVKSSVLQKSWQKIGFPLPPPPKVKNAVISVSAKIPKDWVLVKSGPTDPPMIQFRFPAPLDNYAGEVKAGMGEFSLTENLKLDGAKGFIEIDTRTAITMGDPMLDEAIGGSMLLYTKKFPTAGFILENITGDGQPIAYGHLSPAAVIGIFTLKGRRTPLTTRMEFEPVLGEDGKPRLLIRGAFKIDLRSFNIEGADGPAPARHTLLLDLNFILKEK
jgi:hypothetical protein